MSQFSVNWSPIIFNPNTLTLSVKFKNEDYDLNIELDTTKDPLEIKNAVNLDVSSNPDRWGEDPELGSGTAHECRVLTLKRANKLLAPTGVQLNPDAIYNRGRRIKR